MTPYYEISNDELRAFYSDILNFPLHLHSHLELLYVVSGTIDVTIFNVTKELADGDFAIIFPNSVHRYETKVPDQSCKVLLVICGLDLTGDFFKKVTSYYPTNPFIFSEQLHENVTLAMLELVKERYNGLDLNVCSAFIQLILARVIPLINLEKNNEIENYDLTYKIASYVSEHFQETLTLSELAKKLNVSKYYLSRVFSSKLNTGFNKYLNYIRLNYAMTLIQSTSYTLTRISIESGFESLRTFNRAFKEVFYLSPSEFRKIYKNNKDT